MINSINKTLKHLDLLKLSVINKLKKAMVVNPKILMCLELP